MSTAPLLDRIKAGEFNGPAYPGPLVKPELLCRPIQHPDEIERLPVAWAEYEVTRAEHNRQREAWHEGTQTALSRLWTALHEHFELPEGDLFVAVMDRVALDGSPLHGLYDLQGVAFGLHLVVERFERLMDLWCLANRVVTLEPTNAA